MPTYLVRELPYKLSDSYSQPYQLKNSGLVPVYVGLAPSGVGAVVAEGIKDHTIVPGGFLGLTGKSEVWLAVATGELGEVEQIYDSSGAYSPGPSVVAVRNDVTLLHSQTINYAAGAVSGGGSVFKPDVSQYASVIISLKCTSTSGTLNAALANYIFGSIGCSDSDNLLLTPKANSFFAPQWLLCDTVQTLFGLSLPQTLQIPVTGKYCIGLIEFTKGVTAQGGTILVEVYGSGENITAPRYVSQGAGMVFDLLRDYGWSQLAPASVTTSYILASRNAPTFVEVQWAGGTGGSLAVRLMISGALQTLASLFSPGASGSNGSYKLTYLPMLPILMQATSNAGSNQRSSASQQ